MINAFEAAHADGVKVLREEIESDRVRSLYAGLPLAVVSNVLIAAILAPLLWADAEPWAMALWLAALGASLVFRGAIAIAYRRSATTADDNRIWLARFRAGVAATGLAWGLVSLLLFPAQQVDKEIFLALVLTGLMGGAISAFSLDRASLLLFTLPAVGLFVLRLLIEGTSISVATGALLVVFAIFTFASARRFSVVEMGSLRLNRETQEHERMLRRYEFIVNAVPDAMSVINRAHRYEAVNDAWCDLLKRRREEVIGRTAAEVWGQERYSNYIAPQLERVFAEGSPLTHQALVELPKLGLRECAVTYYPYSQGTGAADYAVVVTHDISELEEARRALLAAKEAAESASRAKSEFLASMSHELRTPLNAVIGFAQLLTHAPALAEEFKDQAREIERAGGHLLALVNDLIDMARIEAGKLELSLEPVGVGPVVADSLAMVAPLAQKQGVTCEASVGPCERMGVRSDYSRLRQILINLLSNAIKYNRPQGRVTLACEPRGASLRIGVSDTGAGIPADKQDRIFNAFDRLGVERGAVEGTGIGLVIAKRIVEAMGGSIGFESAEGRGSTFWIELPVVQLAEEEAVLPVCLEPVDRNAAIPAGPRVLLAEDNPVNQKLACTMLRSLGYPADVVGDGAQAVAAAATGQYALVLMDCQMPGTDGYDATAAIRQAEKAAGRRRLPIIAVTANAMTGDRDKCLAAGMDDYIAKPIDLAELRDKLKARLG